MSEKEDHDELIDDYMDVDEEAETVIDPNVFKIRQSLEQPYAQAFTTAQLHAQIHEGQIDLNPPYQRDVVWSTSKQMEIIDSLFHNFYVPPVIFALVKDEDGEDTRVCVDGKQRLTSIQKFFDGQIAYRDPNTRKLWYYTCSETNKSSRNEIPPEGKKLFAEKLMTCVEYRNLTAGAERDVFQRVQLGVALTAAEKLQAISSPWATWINKLESRYISVDDGLTDVLKFDTKRGRNFQNLAHFIYCCDGFPEQLVPTQTKVEKWMYRADEPRREFQEAINNVLSTLWHLAHEQKLNFPFSKIKIRIAPVEFCYIGVLLYVMRGKGFKDEERAQNIYDLRTELRSHEQDIRSNARVARRCWDFIESVSDQEFAVKYNAPGKRKRKRTVGDDGTTDVDRPGGSKKGKAKAA